MQALHIIDITIYSSLYGHGLHFNFLLHVSLFYDKYIWLSVFTHDINHIIAILKQWLLASANFHIIPILPSRSGPRARVLVASLVHRPQRTASQPMKLREFRV